LELKSLLLVISLAVILSAGLTIVAYYLRPPRPILIYVFKPLTTILILVVALLPGTFLTDRYVGAIGLGLLFSLFGDIWLMLPENRFLYGLVCFLLAHLCYVFAFLTGTPAYGFPWPVLPLAVIGAIILGYLWPALPAGLKGAVSLYVTVIVVMASLAVGRAVTRLSMDTLSAAIGALLFMTSDAILAIDRFRRPFHLAQAAVLGSYFTGQLMIALSIGLMVYRSA
jgi:uncharacterized membrane protein YhhN